MKKFVVLLLSAALIFSFTACSTDVPSSDSTVSSSSNSESESIVSDSSSDESDEPESENESSPKTDASSDATESKKATSTSSTASQSTSTSKTNVSAKATVTPKPTNTPVVTQKPVATSTPTPTKTPVPSNICPICDRELEPDGSCITIHNYTGYGHQVYENGTVYIVCNTCGQKFNRDNYAEPRDWSYAHAIGCYGNAHRERCGDCDNYIEDCTCLEPCEVCG